MIPWANIVAWRAEAPWSSDADVEHDLVMSRVLVEIYLDPFLSGRLAFRGGTALYKLYFDDRYRFSEDIDLVQREPESIGDTLAAIRRATEPWLGEPEFDVSERGTTFSYRYDSEIEPVVPLRLKIEINTREHSSCWDCEVREFVVDNPWYSGAVPIPTFRLDELMATKMRALYQRKKGRDLFDLGAVLQKRMVSPEQVVSCFEHYMGLEDLRVTSLDDVEPLLASNVDYDPDEACNSVMDELVARLEGDPWRGAVGGSP